jgi:hypothetical protein
MPFPFLLIGVHLPKFAAKLFLSDFEQKVAKEAKNCRFWFPLR